MDLIQVSISGIAGIWFMCHPEGKECVLDWNWVNLHLPSFTGGYFTISSLSEYGKFSSMQWFKISNLPPGINVLLDHSLSTSATQKAASHES